MDLKSASMLLRVNSDDMPRDVDVEFYLYAAVVRTAIRDWLNYKNSKVPKQKAIAEEARRWLFVSSNEYTSFETYCHVLEIDVEWIRERIRKFALKLGCRSKDVIKRRRTGIDRFLSTPNT